MRRDTWLLRANTPVAAWLLAAVLVSLVHCELPAARWLLVHALALGALTSAVLVWTGHFTAALLRLRVASHRGEAIRLALANLAAVVVVAGVLADRWPLVALGAVLLAGVVVVHAVVLARELRRALPARFAVAVRYYVAAAVLLVPGVAAGVEVARGGADEAVAARLLLAHALVLILGWVGLTVLGTLLTLWPTVLRTRIAPGAERAARRALPVLVAGVVVAFAAVIAGVRPLAVLGLLAVAAGLGMLVMPMAEAARAKPPASSPAWSLAAGVAWLAVSLVWLIVLAVTAPNWPAMLAGAGSLGPAVLVGFAAQVLLGSLSFLVPVVVGGGATAVRAANAVVERSGAARVVVVNLGLLVCLAPVASTVRVLASLLVLVALAWTLPVLLLAVLAARRTRATERAPAVPGSSVPGSSVPGSASGELWLDNSDESQPQVATRGSRAAGVVGGAPGRALAGLAAVLLAVAVGVAIDPAATGVAAAGADAGVTATGNTTAITVRMEGMRFTPDRIEVPAGDRLVITVVNAGDQTHDLVLEHGSQSPRLAPGETAIVDAGVVGRDLQGWCSLAGHRQMGMVLQVVALGAAQPQAGTDPAAGHDMSHHGAAATPDSAEPAAAPTPDLAAAPGADVTPYDATLTPASSTTVHRITLPVGETVAEVAPGVRQTRWTYAGSAPGPVLRGKVGDRFVITLVNDGSIGHSVDLHAGALAPDGPMRTIQPGESLTYRFTATRAGIWLYHCSTMPMSMHLANGMVGAVIIDPPGLPAVDREYLLVQSELYLGAQDGNADAAKIAAEQPDLVVFNGHATQYDHAPLTARVGERVRVWVLAAGPNRGTAFHVVGGQFDTVYAEGAYLLRRARTSGSQVLGLTAAQGGFVELEFPQAGRYPFVSHVMVDAERGAHGFFEVGD